MTMPKKPQCYRCKFHTNASCTIGKAPACGKYPNGRPKKVFYEAGKCSKFEPQQVNVGGRKKRRK